MAEKLRCPKCGSKFISKNGTKKYKFQNIQKYSCNDCGKNFSNKKLKNSTYSARVIMKALCNYNKGMDLKDSSKDINKQFHVNTYPELVSSWLRRFEHICSFKKFRKIIGKTEDNSKTIFQKEFDHKIPYLFKYHQQKLNFFINNYFQDIRNYVTKIPERCPNKLFNENNFRCSQLKFCKDIKTRNNPLSQACKISEFAMECIKNNYERHDFVEDFMLFNDSATIAVEVPVWIYPYEIPSELREILKIDKPLTGHIDILQIRYGLIYVLDFKPNASKEKPEKVASQLFAYALALSIRTGKWLRNFKCAWFDKDNYYEFSPGDFVLDFFEKNKKEIPELTIKKYELNKASRKYHTSKKFHKTRQESGKETLMKKIKDSKSKKKTK